MGTGYDLYFSDLKNAFRDIITRFTHLVSDKAGIQTEVSTFLSKISEVDIAVSNVSLFQTYHTHIKLNHSEYITWKLSSYKRILCV